MEVRHGRLVLSPTDLVSYIYCPHLSQLSLAVAHGDLVRPGDDDPDVAMMQRRGIAHEERYLNTLRQAGMEVAVVDTSRSLEEQVAETIALLRAGPEIIYQAAFFDDTGDGPAWRGHADFLRRVPHPKDPGSFSYEPEDTKLAKRVRPSAVLQLCDYAAHIERLLGAAPTHIHVVLGGQQIESLRLADYAAYYRATKARFEDAVAAGISAYPDPVDHCGVCSWRTTCDQQRIDDDHLSLVAGVRGEQIRKLTAAAITTTAGLAAFGGTTVAGLAETTLVKMRHQARLQVEARAHPELPPPYELLEESGLGRGLQALPAPSAGDLFFDIEGDPFVGDGGLEYLLGVGWLEADGTFGYRAFWGTSLEDERVSFEEFIDFVSARRASDPNLHVYHYAAYETTALGRMMGRHGTREEEVDELLRAGVLVDLLQVVRQSVRIGLAGYGLKKVESLYMAPRSTDITDGGSSIVEFERWLEDQDQSILDALESYNRDDCQSTQLLRDWLEGLRHQYGRQFGTVPPRPEPHDGAAPEGVAAEASANAELVHDLIGDVEAVPAGGRAEPMSDQEWEAQANWLLAQVLDWYRREDKPEWWRYFDRILRCDGDDLFADTEAVSGLDYAGTVDTVARSIIHRYTFDPSQEHKVSAGKGWDDPDSERTKLLTGASVPAPGDIVDVDPIAGTLDLKRGVKSAAPHPRSLIPPGPLKTPMQRSVLRLVARWVADHGIDAPGSYRSARDLLLRRPPRVAGPPQSGALCGPGEAPEDAVIRLALALDGGTLAVQGPPGSGKTLSAARTIVELVKAGHKVGVTANSHAVISNLLREVAEQAEDSGSWLAISQKFEEVGCDHPMVTQRTSNDEMVADLATADVLAGTAWLFCRPEFAEAFSHLVIDEAGQFSLANVVAVSTAARNLIMVGDPNQLAQPSKGTHPPGVDVSGLSHLLGESDTMPAELGIFLDTTYRLHPSICDYVSEVFYDDRLTAVAECVRQLVSGRGPLSGSGLRWVPVEHTTNRTASLEEAEMVRTLVGQLIGQTWTDRAGVMAPLGLGDILVVAPYNAQVSMLGRLLPAGMQIGTVDRFQGRQAPVVIVSLAASSPEGIHRGMEFLYSRHRLNVAVSRAQALSIVVGSPALLSAQCRTVEQMRLVNGLCRFAEMARSNSAAAG